MCDIHPSLYIWQHSEALYKGVKGVTSIPLYIYGNIQRLYLNELGTNNLFRTFGLLQKQATIIALTS